MKLLKRYRYDLAIALALVLFGLLAYFLRNAFVFDFSREDLENFVMSFGPAAPLIIISIIVLEVVVAPIPGFLPALTAGFVFGSIQGAIYTYLGNIIGSLIVFFLVRKFGRPAAARLFKEDRLEKYSRAVARHENLLLAFYFIPLIPLDILTAAFGLSGVRAKKFISVILLGFAVYAAAFNLFGDYLAELFFRLSLV